MSDSEDSLLEAEYAIVVNEVLDQQPTKKVSTTHTVGPKIQRHQCVGGKQVVVHPFLSADNEMDKIVVCHLIIDEPYLSKHGEVSKAWSDCLNNINAENKSATGDHIFFPPLTSEMLKSCFDADIKFAAASKASVPFHSGCDDEEEACKIQAGIEEIHKKYVAFMDDKENKKSSTISKKNNEKQDAEIIRCASLGMKPSNKEMDKCCHDKNSKRNKGLGSSMSSISMSDGGSLQEALDKRNDIALMKEENKKHKLMIYQKKMEAEIAHTKQHDEAEKQRQEVDTKVAQAMHMLLMKHADKI